MPATDIEPDQKDNKEITTGLVELVAFQIFTTQFLPGTQTVPGSDDRFFSDAESAWRHEVNGGARSECRKHAQRIISSLEVIGIQVKAAKPVKIAAAVTALITIPAAPAYTL